MKTWQRGALPPSMAGRRREFWNGVAYYGSDRHRTAYKGQAMGDAFHFQATLNRFGFRVWSREEVMELLCGVNTAIMDFPDELPETPESRAYCGGHQHTMRAVAHSFGLEYSNRNR